MKDRPIGEKFLHDGHVLEVQEEACTTTCCARYTLTPCFFDSDTKSCCKNESVVGRCCCRSDGRSVVFVDCGSLEEFGYKLPIGCKVEIDGIERVVEYSPDLKLTRCVSPEKGGEE